MGDKSAFVGIVTKLIDITGKALSGEWGTDDVDGCGIPVLRTTNFTNVGKVNYDNVVTRNIQKKNISEKLLKKGDIIIEKSGGTDKKPVGRVIYFEGEENKYLFNNFTGLLRVKDKNEWYPKYVFYSMFANYNRGGTRRFENKTTGLHNLKLDDYIKRLDIQKVSYVDQIYVCKLLDCVRLQIDNMERELDLLDELVKARFVEMFGDSITNDKNLKLISLFDLSVLKAGKSIKTGELSETYDDETLMYPCFGGNGIRGYINHYSHDGNYPIIGRQGAWAGNVNYATGKFYATEHAIVVTPKVDLNTVWYYYGLKYLDLTRFQTGAAQPGLAVDKLNKVFIPFPAIELQNQFASFVQEVDKSRSRIQKSLEASQELFDSLMQEYFG